MPDSSNPCTLEGQLWAAGLTDHFIAQSLRRKAFREFQADRLGNAALLFEAAVRIERRRMP